MKKYFNFVKIEHTLFTLPLIYSGVALGSAGFPSLKLIVLVLIAAAGARTAAFALNRIIDRKIDVLNPRTAKRELPIGLVTFREAVGVFLFGSVLYFGAATLISTLCLILSPIPLIIFAVYPYMKRFTVLAHFGVGLGMAMAPLGGWFAASPSKGNLYPAICLSVFTVMWGAGFDIIYATLDEEFDKKQNLYSFVSVFGRRKALFYSAMFHAAGFLSLALLFITTIHTLYALPFLLLAGALLWIEQWKASNVELAFFRINAALGFVVFGMIITGTVLK